MTDKPRDFFDYVEAAGNASLSTPINKEIGLDDAKRSDILGTALEYARRGWRVLPLHTPIIAADGSSRCSCGKDDCKSIGKHPRTKNGLKDATCDESIIRQWLSQRPDANVGVLTGGGFFAVDVDNHNADGEASLRYLEAKYGALPSTVESATGSGGRHILFRASKTPKNSSGRLGPGLDIRGEGGYIVVAPSLHKSGARYQWKDDRSPDVAVIAEAPEWILEILNREKRSGKSGSRRGALKTSDEVIREGERNQTLTSIGGKLRREGRELDEIETRLLDINEKRLSPPLPQSEVSRIAASVSRYEPAEGASTDLIVEDYMESGGATYYIRKNQNSEIPVRLANFTARLIADVIEDDGSGETSRSFAMEAMMNGERRSITVPQSRYGLCSWAQEAFGAAARISPSQTSVSKLADAIKAFSIHDNTIKTERRYKHTGWTEIGGKKYYLHAGGAIGEDGMRRDLIVRLGFGLEKYDMPEPPDRTGMKSAVESLMELADVTPGDAAGYVMVSSIARAAIGGCDVSVYLAGPSGSFKSELAALALQAFGAGFDSRSLPASFSDTENALGEKAFLVKDAILVVDDFVPRSNSKDMQELNRKAERLFRGAGNSQGRGRMNSSAELKASKPPRGLVFATGEERPQGHSLNARLFIVEVSADAVNREMLTKCQAAARSGVYAKALSGLLQRLAAPGRLEAEKKRLSALIEETRRTFQIKGHNREPDNLAQLLAGLNLLAAFAAELGIRDAEAWRRDGEAKLKWAAQRQGAALTQTEPDQIFISHIAAALESGQCHLKARAGGMPKDWQKYGWKETVKGDFDKDYSPQGDCVGYVDEATRELILIPEAALAKAKKSAEGSNAGLAVSTKRLGEALARKGLLRKDGVHNGAKISINGARGRYWAIPISALEGEPTKSEIKSLASPDGQESGLLLYFRNGGLERDGLIRGGVL